jgi:guanylate kinase
VTESILLVVSAPSGTGKTTILRQVITGLSGLSFSVSHTTRPPRPGEVDGRDYHFVTPDGFTAIRDRQHGGFLEWAEVHGNMYGTARQEVENRQRAGTDVILDIDVQGAMQVRRAAAPVMVFIVPPSLADLEERLRNRGTENDKTLALRLENARQELTSMNHYDYLIVNDQLDRAVESLRSVIIAERSRRRRNMDGTAIRLAG